MDKSFLDGMVIVFSIFQDFGKAYGTSLLFGFEPKEDVERSLCVGSVAAMDDALWIDFFHIQYGYSMIITFILVILVYWRVYKVRFTSATLLGVTYAIMQSLIQRSFSAVWRTFDPTADFVNNYKDIYMIMSWCFVAPPIIFGYLRSKGIGFFFLREHLELSKKNDMRILVFAFIYAIIYTLRSMYLPKSILILIWEPASALIVIWLIQRKINQDWKEHYKHKNAKDLLL